MISNLAQFKLDLKRFHEVVVPANHLEVCKKITIKLHQSIVAGCPENPKGTPVDTGWARANWGVYVGTQAPLDTIGVRGQHKDIFDAMAALAGMKNVTVIWIYNNVPYIEKLEDGHSQQAPTGMVETALHNLQTFVNKL